MKKQLLRIVLPIILLFAIILAFTFFIDKESKNTENTGQAPTKVKTRLWAHESSDIKPDATTIYGKLDNGMRYIIHKNVLPAKRASLRLHIDAGSLAETDRQRGLAHFLEHMVFNGTKTFPDASKLIPQMQRLGISFGAHVNAYTSFDETVYMLDLPNIDKSTMDLAYHVMADFADGALLKPNDIKEELGVILAEKTSGDSIQRRMMKKRFKYLMPKSRIAERFPIGTDETLEGLTHKDFIDFYEHYYIPQKMTFIVVGDIDVDKVKQRIQVAFGQMKNPEKQGVASTLGDISGTTGLQTVVFADEELSTTNLSLVSIHRKKKEVDSILNRAKTIPLDIAHSIINRRFEKITKQEGALITSGSISHTVFFREIEMGNLSVTAKDDNWQAALSVLEQELRRAIEHGFTASEYKEVIADWTNYYEQEVLSASTRKTPSLASSFVEHAHKDYVFSTPDDDLLIFKQNITSLSPAICHQALKKFWATENLNLILSTKVKPDKAESTLLSLFDKSKQVKLDPPKVKNIGKFAYTDFGKAGKVVSTKHIKDLNLHQIQFSNGVRVNYKRTDFDKNTIIMNAHFGTGLLGLPKDKSGLDMMAGTMLNRGGYGKHSHDDLQSLLAGKNVAIYFNVSDESFLLEGTTTPKDLELQLQLMAAFLSDAGFRPEAERQFKANLPVIFSQIKHSEAGAKVAMSTWLHGNDPRFAFPTEVQAKALSSTDVKQWIDPQLKHAALEIGIVGDFDAANLIPLLAKTVGALAKRNAPVSISDSEREITIPKTPVSKNFHYESKVPKALVGISWKAEDNTKHNVNLSRRASILAEVLSERMRVKLREELGKTYSPAAVSDLSETYKNVGFITAYSSVKPKNLEHIGKSMIEIGAKLAEQGISKDELDRALTPVINMLKKSKRQNSYWLDQVIGESQTQPERLDWARQRDDDYKSINVKDINLLAKKYLTTDRSIWVNISPQTPEALPLK